MSSSLPNEAAYGTTEKHPKKLSGQQLEGLVERLYAREMTKIEKRNKAFDEVVAFQCTHNDVSAKHIQRELSEKEDVIVKNVYDNRILLQKKKEEQIAEKKAKELEGTKKISEDEFGEIVNRLYTQSIDHRHKTMEALTKKRYASEAAHSAAAKPQTVRDKAGIEAAIDHLYAQAMQKKRDADAKLEEKYLWKPAKGKPISEEELRESASRLSTKTS